MVILSDYWSILQISLIPSREQVVETRLTEKEKRLVANMDVISVGKHLDHAHHYGHGHKPYDLRSMAGAFRAKATFNLLKSITLHEMLLGICARRRMELIPEPTPTAFLSSEGTGSFYSTTVSVRREPTRTPWNQ